MAKPHYRQVSCHSLKKGDIIWHEGHMRHIEERKIIGIFHLLSFKVSGMDGEIFTMEKVLKLSGWRLSTGKMINPLMPLFNYGKHITTEPNHG